MKRLLKLFAILLIIMISVFCYARYIEPNRLIVRTITIKTDKNIKDCKAVFFTDTHFGKYYGKNHIEKLVDKINARNADIVIFGGDLLDNYARDRETFDFDSLKEGLSKIKATSGKFAVFGNHDYGGGAIRIYEDLMTSCGFKVLNDESQVLEEYQIRVIGYDDYLMGSTSPDLYKIQSEMFNIIVAHEPIISQFIESKSDNFMFSGHTHGGQVSIPYFTKKMLPEGSGQFLKGFYSKEDIKTETSLQMYTSSGIGMTKYPFRLFNTPEIIEVQFMKTKD